MVIPGLRKQASWAMADQGMSSLTNFALTIVVLRTMPLAEFGVFSLVFALYQLTLSAGRALVGQPLAIRFSASPAATRDPETKDALGAALIVGMAGVIPIAVAAALTSGPLSEGLIALAVSLPLLLVQDAWRFGFFAAGRPERAFAIDFIWGIGQVLSVAIILVGPGPSLFLYLLGWGLSGAISVVIAAIVTRTAFQPLRAVTWLKSNRDLGIRYVAESALLNGAEQAVRVLIGIVAGLEILGALTGTRTVFGLITVLILGAEVVGITEGARILERNPGQHRKFTSIFAAALTVAPLIVAAGLALVPDELGKAAIGDSWSEIQRLVWPVAILVAAQGFTTAYRTGLRSLADARSSLKAQILSAPVVLGLGVIGAYLGTALTAAIGLATGNIVSAALFRSFYMQSLNRRRQ